MGDVFPTQKSKYFENRFAELRVVHMIQLTEIVSHTPAKGIRHYVRIISIGSRIIHCNAGNWDFKQ